jgi:hypothetical protein
MDTPWDELLFTTNETQAASTGKSETTARAMTHGHIVSFIGSEMKEFPVREGIPQARLINFF